MGILDSLFGKNNKQKGTAYLAVFSASWCGPSKRFVKEIQNAGITNYTYIDVDEEEDLAEIFNITSIPTIYLLDEYGNVIKKWVGCDDDDPGQKQFVNYIRNSPYNIIPYSEAKPGLYPNIEEARRKQMEQRDAKRREEAARQALLELEEKESNNSEDIGRQMWEQFGKATNRQVITTGHLLFLQQLLGDASYEYRHVSNTSKYPSYMWANRKLLLGDNSKVNYTIPFLWIRTMAKNNVSKFNEAMDLLNSVYQIYVEGYNIDEIVQGIKRNGFFTFQPNFDINANKVILTQFYRDCVCMLRFINFFGANVEIRDVLPSQTNRIYIDFAPPAVIDIVNEMVDAFRNGTLSK